MRITALTTQAVMGIFFFLVASLFLLMGISARSDWWLIGVIFYLLAYKFIKKFWLVYRKKMDAIDSVKGERVL